MIARVVVEGMVQGVGFRWFVREHALRAELAGWVRNNPDGSVELLVSGGDAAVQGLLTAVAQGPVGARVSSVRHVDIAGHQEMPVPFAIKR
jgi:acylphosphatase